MLKISMEHFLESSVKRTINQPSTVGAWSVGEKRILIYSQSQIGSNAKSFYRAGNFNFLLKAFEFFCVKIKI
jgi:hypothetical protein